MKKRLFFQIFLSITLVTVIISGCTNEKKLTGTVPHYGSLEVQQQFINLNEITAAASLITLGEIDGESRTFEHEGAKFTLTPFKIKNNIKGTTIDKNQTIEILELNQISVSLDKSQKKYLLFLKPYKGPMTQAKDAYVINGVYQGKFKVNKEDIVIYDADAHGGAKATFQENFKNKKLEDVVKEINNKIQP